MVLLRFYWLCRCLCWDHASSLAFENITQILWPNPTQKLAWLRLSSRSVWMCQLAVRCRGMLVECSAGRRNLVEDLSWYLINIWYFELYLRRHSSVNHNFSHRKYNICVPVQPATDSTVPQVPSTLVTTRYPVAHSSICPTGLYTLVLLLYCQCITS
jgi:hypothetical protein